MIQWVILYVGIVGLFSCVPLVVSVPVLILVAWLAPRKTEKNLAYVIVLGTGSFLSKFLLKFLKNKTMNLSKQLEKRSIFLIKLIVCLTLTKAMSATRPELITRSPVLSLPVKK